MNLFDDILARADDEIFSELLVTRRRSYRADRLNGLVHAG